MKPSFLHLISGPRNISTALMYSFAQRTDTTVVDEPFYAVYLSKTKLQHPGMEEVLKTQSSDEREVIKSFTTDKPFLFVKNMAHHIEVLSLLEFTSFKNIFLIRDPAYIITSYSKVIESPVMRDIGIEYQFQLFNLLVKRSNNPVVLDSGLLLQNPRAVLVKLCRAIDIPFQESMLHWQSGPKPYDGSWAPYWYANVHQSTGFENSSPKQVTIAEKYQTLYDHAKTYYDQLIQYAITP